MRTSYRAVGAALVVLLSLGTLNSCHEGRVAKRDDTGGNYRLLVIDDNDKERWIEVSAEQYRACQLEHQWPECGAAYAGVGGEPAEQHEPLNPPRPPARDRDENSREVCFKWTVEPVVGLNVLYRWKTNARDIKGNWGQAQRCVRANIGDRVQLTIELQRGQEWPEMRCRIVQTTGRGERIIAGPTFGKSNRCDLFATVKET